MTFKTVRLDNSSYRRGVVLGLTMAEIMLLLVFCLLLGFAALTARDRDRITKLAQERDAARSSVMEESALKQLVADLRNIAGNKDQVSDAWETLVRSRDAMQRLEQAGISVDNAIHSARAITAFAKAGLESGDPDELVRDVKLARQIKGALNDRNLSIPSPTEMASAVQNAANGKGEHDWPPIVNLSEADGFFFKVGSAQPNPDFVKSIHSSIAPRLIDYIKEYNVDIVEVIGHTDEQPMAPRPSNLDGALLTVLASRSDISTAMPADNAGLGLARAVAVMQILKGDSRLAGTTILPFSGGQLIQPGDRLTAGSGGDVKERRRIEIRLRRSNPMPDVSGHAIAASSPAAPQDATKGNVKAGNPAAPPLAETRADTAASLVPAHQIASAQPAPPLPESLVGRATVIDGDTISIGDQRIRLFGIDAPEAQQTCVDGKGQDYPCGRSAALALNEFLSAARPTRCDRKGIDRYGRIVASCYRASGEDIASWLVRSGFALDWQLYSHGLYAKEQQSARTNRAGLWQGQFTLPWEWRASGR